MGATNTVATLGTSLTAQHAKMLNRHADKVTLLFDSDAAGFNAARRAIETLVETELMVSVASLPDGLDPDEYILKYGREQFLAYIAGNSKSSQEFICDHIIEKQGSVSAEQKARVAAEIIPLLSRIKNSIVRREWIRRLAEKIGSTEDAVVAEWQKFSKKGLARDSKIMRQAPTDAGAAANLDANAGIHRTVEEQLLQLLAAHPELAVAVNESVFENGRCLSVFRQLTKGETASEILAEMNDADMSWFRPLIMEERKYPYPQQIVNTLLRDINSRRLRAEFEKLEPQYLHMAAGETAKDETVINRYKQLLCLLKGSGKP
jgi:DNA primase